MIDVVVGMIRQPGGALLMASRPQGKPFEGYWEFPGGKVEAGETPAAALARELHEELNIRVEGSTFAWQIEHVYAHASVRLHFFWVTDWVGNLSTMEGQQVLWIKSGDAWPYPVLPATEPLLEKILKN